MAINITDEIFNRISHEFLYDVSKDAVIRYLNDNGNKIRNLNNITDEMISFLWPNRLHLYVFARENGFHDKPITKFSPNEEKLPNSDSCKETPYVGRNGRGDVLYDGKSKTNLIECIIRGLSNIKGLNSNHVARSKMYFSFKGCNDDTYFYIYDYEYYMAWDVKPSRAYDEGLPTAKHTHTYRCIELKEVFIDELINGYNRFKSEEPFKSGIFRIDKFLYYYDERLNRYRFFNETENFVDWKK